MKKKHYPPVTARPFESKSDLIAERQKLKAWETELFEQANLINISVEWWESKMEKMCEKIDELEASKSLFPESDFSQLEKEVNAFVEKGRSEIKMMEKFEKEVHEFHKVNREFAKYEKQFNRKNTKAKTTKKVVKKTARKKTKGSN